MLWEKISSCVTDKKRVVKSIDCQGSIVCGISNFIKIGKIITPSVNKCA